MFKTFAVLCLESRSDESFPSQQILLLQSKIERSRSKMWRLDSAKIVNFKSFGGEHELNFPNDFVSVIGPNGSGKSNLMDAVCFALAVNAKALRSSKSADLIHRPPGSNPMKRKLTASVTLCFKSDGTNHGDQNASEGNDDDMSDSSNLSADSSTKQTLKSKTLECKRIIQASGANVYCVDGNVVSQKKYVDALGSIGFHEGNRNFLVFQGDVEALAHKTPEQLGALIDFCSGSAELEDEYQEKVKSKQATEALVSSTRKQQTLLSQELGNFRAQEIATKKLQNYQEELDRLKTDRILAQLFSLERPLKDGEAELAQLREELERIGQREEEAKTSLHQAKSDASRARRTLEKVDKARGVEESKLKRLEEDLKVLVTKIDTFEHGVAKQEAKLDEEKECAARHETDLQNLRVEIQDVKSKLEEVEGECADAMQAAAAGSNQVVLSRQQEKKYQALKEAAAAASTSARQIVQGIQRKIDSIHVSVASIRGELEDVRSKQQFTANEVQDYQDRSTKLSSVIKETQKTIQMTETKLKTKTEESKRVEQRRQQLDLEIEQVKARISEAGDARHKSRDEEDLKSIVKTFQQEFSPTKVHGRLVDLCHPTQRRFVLAVTVAAGKDMDSIVVDTRETANQCMRFLREQRLGIATFLPLDLIQTPSPETYQRLRAKLASDGSFRLVADVIACDTAYEKAVFHAVGTSVVCEDLESARRLCFGNRASGDSEEHSIKAVTIDGHVISKSGTMTGGVTNENVNQAGRWNDKEMEDLLLKKDTLEAEKNSLVSIRSSELVAMANVVGTETNKKRVASVNLTSWKEETKLKKEYLASLLRKSKELDEGIALLEKELETLQTKLVQANADVRAIEDEHLGPFLAETGLQDVQAYEQATRETREKYNKKKRELQDHLSRLEEKEQCLSERSPKKKIKMIESRLASRKKELADAQEKKKQLETKAEVAGQRLADAEVAFEEAKEREAECEDSVKSLQKDLEAAQKETNKVSKKVTAKTSNLAELRGKRHDVLQDAQREQISLPTLGTTGRRVRGDNTDEDMTQDDDEEEMIEGSQQTTHTNPSATQYSQSDDVKVVGDNRTIATLDFTELDSNLKDRLLDGEEDRVLEEFNKREAVLQKDISEIIPNKKVRTNTSAVAAKQITFMPHFSCTNAVVHRLLKMFQRPKKS